MVAQPSQSAGDFTRGSMVYQAKRKEHPLNSAFVLRLIWDSADQSWRVLVKSANGGPDRVFIDLESAFLYIAQLYAV